MNSILYLSHSGPTKPNGAGTIFGAGTIYGATRDHCWKGTIYSATMIYGTISAEGAPYMVLVPCMKKAPYVRCWSLLYYIGYPMNTISLSLSLSYCIYHYHTKYTVYHIVSLSLLYYIYCYIIILYIIILLLCKMWNITHQ